MKVALVHELLTIPGGAEKVLRVLARMFPDAPIYTLLYDEKKLGAWFPKERVITSSVQNHAHVSLNHHVYLKKFPKAVEEWDFSGYDLVISSSSAFAHGIITNGKPKHLSYVHSPARYLWDQTHVVTKRASKGLFGDIKRAYLERTFHQLRQWDSEAAERADMLLAPSKEVQRRIELYWRRSSDIVTPSIDDVWTEEAKQKAYDGERLYYLVVSTLVAYKQIELAIEACNSLHLPLVIAGDGAHRAALEHMAGPTITFKGFQNDTQLKDLYRGAKATLFCGNEDFGIVPLESLACGTPVIAQRVGGALETLEEGKTAAFFNGPSASALASVLESFSTKSFDPETCKKIALNFSTQNFEAQIRKHVSTLMS